MMMFVDLLIPAAGRSTTTGNTYETPKYSHSGHTTKLDQLRTLILAGEHLRNPTEGVTLANLRTQRELAVLVGLRSHRNVSRLIRREFPEIAAVMDRRQMNPSQAAPKKTHFLRYVGDGCHLRDTEGGPTADNIKSQQEIAEDLGMTQPTVSNYMREYFPDIAEVMTKRSGRYRGK